MIRLKNTKQFILDWSVPGTQATSTTNPATSVKCWYAPFACKITGIIARLGTAGTTGTQTVDIDKNYTSIFTTVITFASTSKTPNAFAPTTDPVTLAVGDLITLEIDAVHSTPGVDLVVLITIEREPDATITIVDGTFGAEVF